MRRAPEEPLKQPTRVQHRNARHSFALLFRAAERGCRAPPIPAVLFLSHPGTRAGTWPCGLCGGVVSVSGRQIAVTARGKASPPPGLLRRGPRGPGWPGPNVCSVSPQPSDFSVSLKASGKNKHFKVQLVDNVYCIGQRRFPTMDELVEHYKKAPIFTSEHGEKLYLVRALQ